MINRFATSLVISAGSLSIVLLALVYFSLDNINEEEKNGYGIVDAGFKRDWDKVLELTSEASSFNNLVQFEVNRALCGKVRYSSSEPPIVSRTIRETILAVPLE